MNRAGRIVLIRSCVRDKRSTPTVEDCTNSYCKEWSKLVRSAMNERGADLGYFDFMQLTDLLKELFDDSASEKAIVGYYLDLTSGNVSRAYWEWQKRNKQKTSRDENIEKIFGALLDSQTKKE